MAERRESVVLRLDTSSFVSGMRAAAEAVAHLDRTLRRNQHTWRHHRREPLRRSVMHAAYDRRRRARRRRRR